MAINSSIIAGSVTATFGGATTPKIYNVAMATAGTEYSQALTANVVKLMLRIRGPGKLQFSFVSGESGTKYITVWPGSNWVADLIKVPSLTVYFQSDLSSQTLEILEWT